MEENKKQKTSFAQVFQNSWRVTKVLWQGKKSLLVFTALALSLSALFPFVRSWFSGQLINELVRIAGSGQFGSQLLYFVGALLMTDLASTASRTWQIYQGIVLFHYIEEVFDLLILRKRAEIDVASYENSELHNLLQNVGDNGHWRVQGMAERQFYLVENLVEMVAAGVILGGRLWWSVPLVLLGTLPELLVERKYGERKYSITSQDAVVRRKYWEYHHHFSHLPYLIETKLLGLVEPFLLAVRDLFHQFKNKEKGNERRRTFTSVAASSLNQIVLTLVTLALVLQVVRGGLSVGTFTFLLSAIASLRTAISSTFRNIARQYEDSLFVSDLFKVLDLPPALPRSENPVVLPKKKTPDIVFSNVSFAYPGKSEIILKDINLHIPAGTKLAIVGANGAGKSTLIKLLCRFYDPTGGSILIGGVPMRELDLDAYYGQIGMLFQEYANYHFAAKDAIALGDKSRGFSQRQVEAATKSSEAFEFIKKWKAGFAQQLGKAYPEGLDPSIGQWQKLAIARLFYRNANIWILDEPTASVDAESEARIFEQLEKLPKDKTVILISHRFSTVRHADKIVVLEDGKISEEGSHRELLLRGGTYARLFKLQAEGYK